MCRSVGEHLKRWTEGGQYPAFSTNREDTYVRAVSVRGFRGHGEGRSVSGGDALLSSHRANDFIYDERLATTLKLFIIDEAWRFFKHQAILTYIIEALKTWRKKNAAMIMATQSIEALNAEVLRPAAENCPTKIVLANPNLDTAVYHDVLGLTPTEQERVRHLTPKRQFLLKRDQISKVLNLNVDRESYWLFTTNPYEAKRRREAVSGSACWAHLKS